MGDVVMEAETAVDVSSQQRERKRPKARSRSDRQGSFTRTLAQIDATGEDSPGAALRAAALVRAMRVHAGLSQAALGREIDVTQARISEIEAGLGKHGPSFGLLERIALACDVEIGFATGAGFVGARREGSPAPALIASPPPSREMPAKRSGRAAAAAAAPAQARGYGSMAKAAIVGGAVVGVVGAALGVSKVLREVDE